MTEDENYELKPFNVENTAYKKFREFLSEHLVGLAQMHIESDVRPYTSSFVDAENGHTFSITYLDTIESS